MVGAPIRPHVHNTLVFTDASQKGWCAHLKAQLHQFKFSLKNTYFIQTVLGNKNQVHIQLNPVTAQCY